LPKNSLKNLIKGELNFAPLKDFVIYCKTGKTVYGKERKFSERGLRFLHATNITDIGINYKKDENFIDPASKMNFPSAYVKMGDILFVRVGVGCAGRVAIVDTKDDEGIATDYIHMFRVKNINPYFIVIYLKTRFGKDSINLLKHGVGTVSINKTELLSIMIPIVSQELQNEVENKYKLIIEKYHQNMTSPDIKKEMDSLIIFLEMSLMNINNGGTYVEMRDV
jgi:type I restriction enzyme M protein